MKPRFGEFGVTSGNEWFCTPNPYRKDTKAKQSAGLNLPKTLQQEWALKLAQSGFMDIEISTNKDHAVQHQVFHLHSVFKLQPSYVEMLSKLFDTETNLSGRNKLILQLHLDGFSQRKIVEKISKLYTPISQQAVHKQLKKLRKKARQL